MIDDHEHHKTACPGGALKSRIETAGTRTQCAGCGAYWRVSDTSSPSITIAPTHTTRLVCREHHDQSVTAAGKGCQTCAQARRDREKDKAAKAQARRAKLARV